MADLKNGPFGILELGIWDLWDLPVPGIALWLIWGLHVSTLWYTLVVSLSSLRTKSSM